MKRVFLTMSILGFSFTAMAGNHSGSHSKDMDYKTLSFEKGVTTLSDSQRSELNEITNKYKEDDRDMDVTIATWSDEPIPNKNKSLSSEQRKIADQRSDSIKEYMKDLKLEVDDYETYNMAENPNFLARTFNTEESKLKKAVKSEDADDDVLKSKYKLIKEQGREGMSVVIVRYDD